MSDEKQRPVGYGTESELAEAAHRLLAEPRASRDQKLFLLVQSAHAHWDRIGWPEDKESIRKLAQAMAILGEPQAGKSDG